MKNIINEKPSDTLNGRTLACVNFTDNGDIHNKDILDIGCGYGWCELNFLSRGARKITATEKSGADLRTIQKNIRDQKVQFTVCDATNLLFANETFDTVVMWDVIEHIPRQTEPKMFSEVNRVLKQGGHFYISTPHASFLSKITDPAWWFAGHRHYSKKRIGKFAEESGFEIIKIEIRGAWWAIFSTLNMYIAKWIFKRPPFFSEKFSKKENAEYERENGFVVIFIKLKKR